MIIIHSGIPVEPGSIKGTTEGFEHCSNEYCDVCKISQISNIFPCIIIIQICIYMCVCFPSVPDK